MKKKQSQDYNICDNCSCGTWNTTFYNLDSNHQPITLRYPYYHNGLIGIIRGSKACDKFKDKPL